MLSTTVVLLAITSIPLTIVFILIASPLATLLLGNASFSAALKMAAVVVLIQNFSIPGLAWLRARVEPPSFRSSQLLIYWSLWAQRFFLSAPCIWG